MNQLVNDRLQRSYDLLSQRLELMLQQLDQPLNAQDLKRLVDSQVQLRELLREEDSKPQNTLRVVLEGETQLYGG